ncbi:MAG: type VI secretion system tip protein TssI/VgrG [Polyangiales bacterium]
MIRNFVGTLEAPDLPCEMRVCHVQLTERLDRGFVALVVGTTSEPVTPTDLVGGAASVLLRVTEAGHEGDERNIHGLMTECEAVAVAPNQWRVTIVIEDRMRVLARGQRCRIFQEKSVVDVVSDVLEAAGLHGAYTWETGGSYPPNEYVVQYNESDLTFVQRLLEESGIAYTVVNDVDVEQVVFFDDSTTRPPIEGPTLLQASNRSLMNHDVVMDGRFKHRATSDAVMLRDYDFMDAARDLSLEAEAPESAGRQVYLHPGGSLAQRGEQSVAEMHLERHVQFQRTFTGRSDCPRLVPGFAFDVYEHGYDGANVTMLVTAVAHTWHIFGAEDAPAYQSEFEAIPQEVRYRPTGAAPKPSYVGVHTAFVTGPNTELHGDEWGRVKVRFPWDPSGVEDDTSSAWLRVGQYPLGGSMVIPRVGFEVLVDFEMGDIDRPYVAGHLYNAEAMPPYALPDGATRSSLQTATTDGGAGANELRFEDAAGAEEILVNASFDYIVAVGNDATVSINNDSACAISGSRTLSVGADVAHQVAGSATTGVGANQEVTVGDGYSTGTGGSLSLTVGATRKIQTGGDLTEDVAGDYTRDVGALESVTALAGVTSEVVGNATTDVAAAMIETVAGSRMVTVTSSFSETVGALKMTKAKTIGVSVGAAYAVTAAAESVDCGEARTDAAKGLLAITAGSVKVKAGDVVLTGENKLVLRAGAITIELAKAGTVKIKAPNVEITNADALNQVMFRAG